MDMGNFAFLFPGQGSQYVGMGKKIYETNENAKQIFKQAEEILDIPLRKLCFEGDMSQLTLTYHAQPAILTLGYISYRLFMDNYQSPPLYMLGHSLGEITALTCAGVYTFEEALQIVYKRGLLMHEAAADQGGAMLSIQGLPVHIVNDVCESVSNENSKAVVSNINAARQIVISGHLEAVNRAAAILERMGSTAIPLKVSAPFHSPLMAPAEEQFKQYLTNFTVKPFNSIVISNLDALPYRDEGEVPDKLSKQLTHSVKWVDCLRHVTRSGISWAVEAAPKTVLKTISGSELLVFGLDHEVDASRLDEQIQQLPDRDFVSFVRGCLAVSVSTKNNNFNPEQFESGVLNQVKMLESTLESIEEQNRQATTDEMFKSLDALLLIMNTKQISAQEQQHRLDKLFATTLPVSAIQELHAYMKGLSNRSILV